MAQDPEFYEAHAVDLRANQATRYDVWTRDEEKAMRKRFEALPSFRAQFLGRVVRENVVYPERFRR